MFSKEKRCSKCKFRYIPKQNNLCFYCFEETTKKERVKMSYTFKGWLKELGFVILIAAAIIGFLLFFTNQVHC